MKRIIISSSSSTVDNDDIFPIEDSREEIKYSKSTSSSYSKSSSSSISEQTEEHALVLAKIFKNEGWKIVSCDEETGYWFHSKDKNAYMIFSFTIDACREYSSKNDSIIEILKKNYYNKDGIQKVIINAKNHLSICFIPYFFIELVTLNSLYFNFSILKYLSTSLFLYIPLPIELICYILINFLFKLLIPDIKYFICKNINFNNGSPRYDTKFLKEWYKGKYTSDLKEDWKMRQCHDKECYNIVDVSKESHLCLDCNEVYCKEHLNESLTLCK